MFDCQTKNVAPLEKAGLQGLTIDRPFWRVPIADAEGIGFESLFDPSFEMSFAAVIALVALYEWFASRSRPSLSDVSAFWRILHKGSVLLLGAALTTLVASVAIAPFALYHFHRITRYGLIANLIAEPLVSFLIMPMALLSLIAMPFGLEAWPLKAMGFGIDLMVGVGKWVAGWPGAVSVLPQQNGSLQVSKR